MERVIMVARLKPDVQSRALELAASPPPDNADDPGVRRSVYVSPSEVVFVIEGDQAELQTREWFDDPVRSARVSSWLPLFDGPLHRAREAAVWEEGELGGD